METAVLNKKSNSCKTAYQDTNISFPMEDETVFVGNIVFERFTRSIPMHAHSDNSYEIHYISSGYGQVTVDGIKYDIKPGTLYITGPHIQHSMIPDKKDPLSEYCIYLKLSDKRKNDKRVMSPMRIFRSMSSWYGPDRTGMDVLMTALFHELKEQSIGYRAVVESLIRQLIICCVRNYSADEKDNDLPGLSSYDNQFLIIEEAFLYEYNTLTLTDLSARLNLSTRQTQRLLTKHYGMNFRNKITEAKMSAAALMLRSFEMNISDLAEKTGYSSAEHFSAAFKRYYGISAGEYRKKHSP